MADIKEGMNLREIVELCRDTLEDLNNNTIAAFLRAQNKEFDDALCLVEKYLPAAENVMDQDKADLGIRAATIFLIRLWSKLRQGGSINELTKDDWNSLLANAAEETALMDPQEYSLMVFDLYRKSIAFAIDPMKENASESVIKRLEEIVSLMDSYTESLKAGEMLEAKYIDENLWLSLEAIFLVLTDRMSHALLPEEKRDLAEALSALVFQKIRYSIYDKELAVVNECLAYQAELDQRLTDQVNSYLDALRDELDKFDVMVEKAFNTTDFQAAFRGSADLADSLGAKEILKTQQDIDDFFMA